MKGRPNVVTNNERVGPNWRIPYADLELFLKLFDRSHHAQAWLWHLGKYGHNECPISYSIFLFKKIFERNLYTEPTSIVGAWCRVYNHTHISFF